MTTNSVRPAERRDRYDERGYRFRWMVMAVVIVADVMDLLDATIANLAGPSIQADLDAGASTLQWVLAAYTMSFAIGLVTSARLGDLVGRRRMFLLGMVGFTLASLLCGLAPSAGFLIGARVLQGLFGAAMIPQGLAMVKQSFAPEDLQKAFIPFGPIMGLAAVLGPIIAGVLLDADLFGTGWRMIFLINVPVGLVGAVLAWRYLPDVPRDPDARLDPWGALLLTIASALLIYPLVQGREHDWPWWCFAMMAGAAVVFALFVVSERRSSHPVVEPSLFRHRGYVAGVLFIGVFFVSMNGVMLTVNLFLQLGQGFEPLHTGLAMTPWALGMAIGAALSGAALGPKLGRRVLHGGLVVGALGTAWLAWTIGSANSVLSGWDVAPMFLVIGLGSGVIFAPLFDIILADLDDREVGTGSGVLNAVQQFGGALGVAVIGTLYFEWIPDGGWNDATRMVLSVSIALSIAAFLVAFLLPRRAREDAALH
ncbi:DHA2 family efflux MFS transporter permease subunit [Nocardioides mangrovi]|uniref:DHA2 family efflux MFS transporter permease subunit n=1 Tax=Nocardioides mangrovi TaxID=2874580 RepID=A0ABS7U886_9ACTN|nr:DHA2 family efflux MFS transporter permease subunit [Nocardioides mangrovi]MBZ5737060.1 DHA2 family efflux MFS transporter permease subunit [Nocardioides mangrovi]